MVSSTPYILASIMILLSISTTIARKPKDKAQDLVHSSCVRASYPNLCMRTLASYSGTTDTTPRDLAKAAVRVSLSKARKANIFLSELQCNSKREEGARKDCVEQIGDSIDNLRKTLTELQHLKSGNSFDWQMSNAETWVSAALTNEDTCLDSFKETTNGKVIRTDVRKKITNVARVTSNALSLITLLHHN